MSHGVFLFCTFACPEGYAFFYLLRHTPEIVITRFRPRPLVCLCRDIESLPDGDHWAGLKTIIKVTSYRHILKGQFLLIKEPAVRYYISSLEESVEAFAQRIRQYWHVENKVHYVRDVTQGEDASRIRVQPLPNNWALARNLALNLYRDYGFDNMAQAQRKAGQGLDLLKSLFRMK
ncbi:MAG: ISAs1 family transposase [Phormidesmis sp.]